MSLLKELFRPTNNRYYLGPKKHAVQFILYNLPLTIITLVLIFIYPKFWWLALFLVAFLIVHYAVFDKLTDKLHWKILGKHYEEPRHSPDDQQLHALMDEYSRQPTPELKEQIAQLVKHNK